MNYRSALLSSAMALACAVTAGQVSAQTSGGAPAASSGNVLGEVVVTARRRNESLQTVPIAIAAFTQKALTERSITNAFSLNTSVPGLTVEADSGNPGLPSFAIRGRGQVFGTSAGSVETYFADVPLSAPFQIPTLPPQFFDLQSFQVLKGPQGTLFGRSTTGGAVLIVPQAPTDNFGGYVRLQGGTYHDFQFEGAVNLPLIEDKVMLRLAAFDAQRDGYMHTFPGAANDLTGIPMGSQTYDNVNTSEFRATLLVKPVSGLTNSTLFTYHYDQTRTSPSAGVMLGAAGTVPEPGYETRYSGTNVNLQKGPTDVWAFINTTTYDLTSDLTVKNIFGYINSTGFTDDGSDSDGIQGAVTIDLPAADQRPRRNYQTTDELQLQGKDFNNRLTWIIGGLADYTREPGGQSINITSETFTGASGAGGPGSLIQARFEQNNINSYGAFGSATFKILDNLDLSGGFRHSWYSIAYVEGCGTATAPSLALEPNGGASCTPSNYAALATLPTLNVGGNTYNATLDYRPFDHVLVYGGFRHGYKHGGYNPSAPPTTPPFAAENVDDYSIGVKSDFHVLDRPARFNIEGYDDKYTDYQAAYLGITPGGLITTTLNIPKSTFEGFDADFQIDPTDWLNVSASYSYIHAYINSWSNTALNPFAGVTQTVNLAINPLPYISPNKASVTFRLHKELDGNRGELVLAPTVSYQDKFYTTVFENVSPADGIPIATATGLESMKNAGGGYVPGYTTVDLRAEWNHAMGTKVDAALNVTNLTNRLFFLGNSGTLNYGVQSNAYGPPRMINVELSTRF